LGFKEEKFPFIVFWGIYLGFGILNLGLRWIRKVIKRTHREIKFLPGLKRGRRRNFFLRASSQIPN